ncbi:MAG: relaxase/mobilization nuclease domain-containing protein [Lachnospiraceae bacterium]|nr:relaxase/mobilization nuclease domain-containing protein [Lachnospiraceae bacterium]
MATTRIIPMHINKGKTISQCMKARIDYVKNPDKTEDGTLISSYECTPESADHEFVLARNEYMSLVGKQNSNEVIAYQLRQSFKPGEVTAEEANQIGYELASRLLGGDHAFLVATHTDKKHIHNHIVFCATSLDCTHKFRNRWNSSRLVAEISDELCREHHLSVIENPQNKTVSYDKWQGDQKELTQRDSLRMIVDAALRLQPDGFDALMQLMEEAGCLIKQGAHISIRPPEGKRYIRLDSLGAEYSEASLRQSLDGKHIHIPKVPRRDYTPSQVKRLIDIEAKLRTGKGKGYMVWAERNNIDAKAQSIIYLKEHQISSLDELEAQIMVFRSERNALHASIREKQNRMKEINQQRQAIRDYRRTKEIYTQYKDSGWSVKFYNEHRDEIEAHRKAQAVYTAAEGKLPTLKELSAEYDSLRELKKKDELALEELKPQLTTLNHIKYNCDILMRDVLPEEKYHTRSEREDR